MKLSTTLQGGLVLLTLSASNLIAQRNAVSASTTLTSVRGELNEDNPLNDNYGMSYSLSYVRYFKNEQWMATLKVGRNSQVMERDFTQKSVQQFKQFQPPVTTYTTTTFATQVQQTSATAGLRYCFTNSINKYNPYLGQLLPYIGVNAGGMLSDISMKNKAALPEGYSLNDGKSFNIVVQGEAGIGYVMDKHWMLEIFGTLQPAFSDYYDGISGTSGKDDWLAQLGLGVQYRF